MNPFELRTPKSLSFTSGLCWAVASNAALDGRVELEPQLGIDPVAEAGRDRELVRRREVGAEAEAQVDQHVPVLGEAERRLHIQEEREHARADALALLAAVDHLVVGARVGEDAAIADAGHHGDAQLVLVQQRRLPQLGELLGRAGDAGRRARRRRAGRAAPPTWAAGAAAAGTSSSAAPAGAATAHAAHQQDCDRGDTHAPASVVESAAQTKRALWRGTST